MRFASDYRKIKDEAKRAKAYHEYHSRPENQGVDSLSRRISAEVPLTSEEIKALVKELGEHCRALTKTRLRYVLMAVPYIDNDSYFDRVKLGDKPHYCAGQDYTAELPRVRRALLS